MHHIQQTSCIIERISNMMLHLLTFTKPALHFCDENKIPNQNHEHNVTPTNKTCTEEWGDLELYLYCMQDLRVAHSNSSTLPWILGARCLQYSSMPIPCLYLTIPKSVHPQSSPFPLMPCTLVSMTIRELIHTIPMHLVRKVLSSVSVTIPDNGF